MPPAADEVELLVDGVRLRHWSEIEIRLGLDSLSTVTASFPFDPSDAQHRATFRPFDFVPVDVLVGGVELFRGIKVGIHPNSDESSNTVKLTAYSLPGPLQDCTAPEVSLPLEFNKLGLRAIAEKLTKPFGVEVEFQADEGAVFEKESLEVDKTLFDFLSELARQRNLVVSNTPDGKLLCWQSVAPGNPVADLEGQPLGSVSATFSPQDYFSEITGYAPTKRKRKGAHLTEKNPFLQAILRPHAFTVEDSEKGDLPTAVRAKLGRMLANSATFAVSNLPTWRDPSGELWRANTTVNVKHRAVMIYKKTEFLIRSVSLVSNANIKTAELELVLPGSFSGVLPDRQPWDE